MQYNLLPNNGPFLGEGVCGLPGSETKAALIWRFKNFFEKEIPTVHLGWGQELLLDMVMLALNLLCRRGGLYLLTLEEDDRALNEVTSPFISSAQLNTEY